jgi:hypothetical protein
MSERQLAQAVKALTPGLPAINNLARMIRGDWEPS